MSKVFEGQLSAAGLRFAIIVSRFNSFITERLLGGAMDALTRAGGSADLIDVDQGAGFVGSPDDCRGGGAAAPLRRADLPERGDPRRDAAFRLRGGGSGERDRRTSSSETGVPVAFGVLTTNTLEQAIDRAGAKGGNKGFDAAMTAIEMANLLRTLRQAT